jgi:hypothetical protein
MSSRITEYVETFCVFKNSFYSDSIKYITILNFYTSLNTPLRLNSSIFFDFIFTSRSILPISILRKIASFLSYNILQTLTFSNKLFSARIKAFHSSNKQSHKNSSIKSNVSS